MTLFQSNWIRINSMMDTNYKVLKLTNGDDLICKILGEDDNSVIVECPMQVLKTKYRNNGDDVVEHTGLQRWISFTNDIEYIIDKEKIIGLANLSPEVMVYYKMVSRKTIEESEMDAMESYGKTDEEVLEKINHNMDKLVSIMEGDDEVEDEYNEEDTLQSNKDRILH